jgi:hypothetical protein
MVIDFRVKNIHVICASLLIGLLLTECAWSSENAQLLSPATESPSQALELQCAELNKNGKHKYFSLSGFVIRAEKLLPRGDCFHGGCDRQDAELTNFYASMTYGPLKKPHSWMDTEEQFRVYTKPETVGSLKTKEPYFEVNKTYQFCAREIDNKLAPSHTIKFYQIDDLDTIQQLK